MISACCGRGVACRGGTWVSGLARFHPSGADGGGWWVRCGCRSSWTLGRDGGADGLWRGAVADRGVPRQWRRGGAGCGGGGQAAPAGVGDLRAGRGPVGLVGGRRRALRGSGAAARGRGSGAAARACAPAPQTVRDLEAFDEVCYLCGRASAARCWPKASGCGWPRLPAAGRLAAGAGAPGQGDDRC